MAMAVPATVATVAVGTATVAVTKAVAAVAMTVTEVVVAEAVVAVVVTIVVAFETSRDDISELGHRYFIDAVTVQPHINK